MKKYFILLTVLLFTISLASAAWFDTTEKAAVVELSGSITPSSGGFGSGSVTPQSVRDLTSRARGPNTEAIIYEWNSGGGAVVASKEIRRHIESVELPTVCRFRDMAASGAYLASMGCDRIVADPASMTGSIGVRSSYLEFSGLLDRYGVEYVNISSGDMKETGSQFKNLSEEERQILEEKVDKLGNQFVNEVAEERNLNSSEIEKISTGEIFLGSEARNIGLVDRLGGRETAVDAAVNLTGQKLEPSKIETSSSFNWFSLLGSDSIIGELFSSSSPVKAEWG